jgi:hypothetical protein
LDLIERHLDEEAENMKPTWTRRLKMWNLAWVRRLKVWNLTWMRRLKM